MDDASVLPSPALTTAPLARSATSVLIADDNRDSADTLAILLEFRGCAVRTVYDGEEAIAAFAREPADVVLLDLGMPKIGGLDACRAIRALAGGASATIVALTGWGQQQDRARSRDAGFDEHFVKPVDHQTLAQLIDRARHEDRQA